MFSLDFFQNLVETRDKVRREKKKRTVSYLRIYCREKNIRIRVKYWVLVVYPTEKMREKRNEL